MTDVFISSTYLDNEHRRRRVEDAILQAGMHPIGMERFTASRWPLVDECLKLARDADVYVGILAHRYGWIPPGHGVSITELEYDAARDAGRERLIFLLDPKVPPAPSEFDESDREEKQVLLEHFKDKCRREVAPVAFSEDNLQARVLEALLKRDRMCGFWPMPGGSCVEVRTIAQLLMASHAVVEFNASLREKELDELRSFCSLSGGSTLDVRLVTGPSGSGKTRLVQHFAENELAVHRPPWHSGSLKKGQLAELIPRLRSKGAPALLVVDNAESHAVGELLVELLGARVERVVRVLLLARNSGAWWESLQTNADLQAMLTHHTVLQLAPVGPDIAERWRYYQHARERFAAHPFVQQQKAIHAASLERRELPLGISEEVAYRPEATEPAVLGGSDEEWLLEARYGSVLFIHMAALVTELGGRGRKEALDRIINDELELWCSSLSLSSDIDRGGFRTRATRVAAAIALTGGATESQVLQWCSEFGFASNPSQADSFYHRLAHYYPAADGVAPLQPDVLGETLVRFALDRAPHDFIERVLAPGTDEAIRMALTLLERLSADHPGLVRPQVERFLAPEPVRHADSVLQAILRVTQNARGGVLGQALVAALGSRSEPGLALDLRKRLVVTTALQEVWIWTEEQLVASAKDDDERASRLLELAQSQHEAGQHGRAWDSALRAIELRSQLAGPDASGGPSLPDAQRLALISSAVGRHDLAASLLESVVGKFFDLHRQRRHDLELAAGALLTLGSEYGELGRWEDAVKATEAAVELYRRVTPTTASSRVGLAKALDNLGIVYSRHHRWNAALASAVEATNLRRTLCAARPDAIEPDLARSLHNLANRYSDRGRWKEAVDAMLEAIAIRERIFVSRPDAVRRALAASWDNLGYHYIGLARFEDALSAIDHGLNRLQSDPAHPAPDTTSARATAELNRSAAYAGLGKTSEALAAAQQARNLRRVLFWGDRGRFAEPYAEALKQLAKRYSEHKQPRRARQVLRAAVLVFRWLTLNKPGTYSNRSVLTQAAIDGREDLVELLLEPANADWVNPRQRGHDGVHALDAAAEAGHEAIVRRLLEVDPSLLAEPGLNGRSVLMAALVGRHVRVVNLLTVPAYREWVCWECRNASGTSALEVLRQRVADGELALELEFGSH